MNLFGKVLRRWTLTLLGVGLFIWSISLYLAGRWILATLVLLGAIAAFWIKARFLWMARTGAVPPSRTNAMFVDQLVGYRRYIREKRDLR